MRNYRWVPVNRVGAAVAFSAILLLSVLPGSAQASPVVMKLSTATVHDTQTERMERFAAAVEQDSGRRIKREIYPASQLGTIPRQIEGVQFGTIQGPDFV